MPGCGVSLWPSAVPDAVGDADGSVVGAPLCEGEAVRGGVPLVAGDGVGV
jgi:hypothetical protein